MADKAVGIAGVIIGVLIFLLDAYFVYVSVGFGEKHCLKCKGYLNRTTQHKNKYVGNLTGRIHKNFVNYEYSYTVNGKTYHISGGVPGKENDLSRVVDITYQKRNPRYSYVKNLTFPIQPAVAAALCPLWIILVVCGVNMVV